MEMHLCKQEWHHQSVGRLGLLLRGNFFIAIDKTFELNLVPDTLCQISVFLFYSGLSLQNLVFLSPNLRYLNLVFGCLSALEDKGIVVIALVVLLDDFGHLKDVQHVIGPAHHRAVTRGVKPQVNLCDYMVPQGAWVCLDQCDYEVGHSGDFGIVLGRHRNFVIFLKFQKEFLTSALRERACAVIGCGLDFQVTVSHALVVLLIESRPLLVLLIWRPGNSVVQGE